MSGVGQRIRAARELSYDTAKAAYAALVARYGDSLEGLGDYDAYSKIERGARKPNIQALAAIARTLGVSMQWLAEGESGAPESLREWLKTAAGREHAKDQWLVTWLHALPIPPNADPDPGFWELAAIIYKRDLRGPEAVEALADTHKRH